MELGCKKLKTKDNVSPAKMNKKRWMQEEEAYLPTTTPVPPN